MISCIRVCNGEVTIDLGSGDQVVYGTNCDDVIISGSGDDTIKSKGGDDYIFSGSGDDTINSGAGDDIIISGMGNDVIKAGSGDDLIISGDGDDTIRAGSGDDIIISGSGADYIFAGSGDDLIISGDGDDIIKAGAGDDIIISGSGNDTVYAGSGDDYVNTGSGDDTVYAGSGDDVVILADGNDYAVAGSGDDVLLGCSGDDWLDGNSGDDLIIAGSGNDYVSGGSGNDTIIGGSGNDEIYGGSGCDYILGGTGNDIIYGGSGDDIILAGSGNDEIHGGSGNDTIYGESGDDIIMGDAGNDYINAGSGNNIVDGGKGHDVIYTGNGMDEVYGGQGNDFIVTGSGDDIAAGGKGTDILLLGSGNDTALFNVDDNIKKMDFYDGGSGSCDTLHFDVTASRLNTIGITAQDIIDYFNNTAGNIVDFSGLHSSIKLIAKDFEKIEVEVSGGNNNDAPMLELFNLAFTNIDENTDTSTPIFVADINIIDDGVGTNVLSLSGADATLFEIVGNQLFIKSGVEIDFEANPSLDVNVEVDDASLGGAPDDTASLSVAVNDLNETPIDISLTQLGVDENALGAVIGNVSVTDPDYGDSHTFLLSDARFEIVNGQLKLVDGVSLDFEAEPTIHLNIKATDSGGLVFDKDFVITVNNVAEAASIGGDLTGNVTEDLSVIDTGTLTVDDPDGVGEESFQAGSYSGSYGSLDLLSDGSWTYNLDNLAVQSLGDGDTVVDSFTILSFDGTSANINIDVT
ncbi:MAG: VCBS domain-containing protein, partial [Gammaproteobacteria bacterium]